MRLLAPVEVNISTQCTDRRGPLGCTTRFLSTGRHIGGGRTSSAEWQIKLPNPDHTDANLLAGDGVGAPMFFQCLDDRHQPFMGTKIDYPVPGFLQ